MRQQVTEQMKEHIIAKICAVVDLDCESLCPPRELLPQHSALPSPPVTPSKPAFDLDRGDAGSTGLLPSLEKFLDNLVNSSRIQVPTLLCTLIYLDRIQLRIPPVSRDTSCKTRMPDTRHRVLLATIICAAKYLNDSSPKNKHWAMYSSSLFHYDEVNLMEQQLLALLNFELRFTEEDCIRAFSMFFKSPVSHHPPTPPYEEACKSVQLELPSSRRASRPARISISGPAHLHSSYSRSSAAGAAPLSPPTSASRISFNEPQPPAYQLEADSLMGSNEGNEQDDEVTRSGVTNRYAVYGSYPSRCPAQTSVSGYVPPPKYTVQAGSWSRHEEAPQNSGTSQENQINSTTSWPALSVRANGFLERVWGSSQNGRGVKNSRSSGGIFRTSQTEGSASRA